jgi:NAD(P)-dependent dehydrogenase (short-subunit alcohol dehydrogenase family)
LIITSAMSAPAKVALVTASSAGLGAAIVHALAPNYRVVVNYFSRPEKAADVISSASKIPAQYSLPTSDNDSSPRFYAIKADASSRSSIQSLVDETVSTMGRLDVVISNAGWTRMTNFFDLDAQVNEDDWDRCFNANVKSHLWLLYAAKSHLSQSPGGGAFVTVASLAGVRPSGSSLPYSVTKAAEIHLTKGLALICGKEVRCNSVSPGMMMTEWGERFPKEKVEATKKKAALGELATPEDVAEQVRALVMSRSITGQNIVIDGGIAV